MRGGSAPQRGLSGSQYQSRVKRQYWIELCGDFVGRRRISAVQTRAPRREVRQLREPSFAGQRPHVAEVRELVVPTKRVVRGDREDLFHGVQNQEHDDEASGLRPPPPTQQASQSPSLRARSWRKRRGILQITHWARPSSGSAGHDRPAATGSATRLISWYSSSALT